VGGAACLIAAATHERALHSSLRRLLEERLGGFVVESIETQRDDTPIVIEGVVMEDAQPSDAGAVLRVWVDRVWLSDTAERASGGVALTVVGSIAAGRMGEWMAGRRVRAPAVLRRPARYLNDGVPDMERQMARRRITLVGTVKSGALVDVVSHGSPVHERAAAARAFVRRSMARNVGVRDVQSGAIATAILIGDRGALDRDVERRLQEAGTYHVIAISGGNIAILAGLVLAILWALGIRGRAGSAIAIGALVGYAMVTGGGSSVMRATVMAAIYLALRLIDQKTAPIHAMAVTAAALLILSPLSVGDVGFWLTFGATAAIVAGTGRVPLPQAGWLRAVAALVVASACAEVVLMPVGAAVFQRVTVAGLAANLVAVPCMALVQIAAMATAFVDAIALGRVAAAAGLITHLAAWALVQSSAIVEFAPWLTWRVPPPSLCLIAAYYAALILWFLRSFRSAAVAAAALYLWIAASPPTLARVHGDG
jgi:competence protein ComEC